MIIQLLRKKGKITQDAKKYSKDLPRHLKSAHDKL